MDLHLAGEGRHEEIYARLGAHVIEHEGVAGHRRSRSGRPPRRPSPWSATSTTGTPACTRCARSARAGSGSCSSPRSAPARPTSTRSPGPTATSFDKADPYAFEAEVPPKTASVVHEPEHVWRDADVAGEAPREHAARGADVGLRGPPRLVAAEPARGQPLADLPRARRRARRLREGHGLHPPRAAAGHAPPVHAARGATR